ncbi:MAG TPA: hypothetical protein EYH22_01705 [Candidatus Nanopusillus sp.]|nr:hypothetical protein [Candidatus Nanopusillus sp.]
MWLERPEIHWNALDVLAHQIVGLTIDFGEVEIDKVWETIKRSYVYKDLSYGEFLEVIEFLDSIRLIKFDKEKNKITKTRKGHFYYIENLSMIPDEKSYDVVDITTKIRIGILHEEFIAKYGNPGTVFILRGFPWKIEKVERNKVFVSLSKDFESAIPSWEGELLPVPFEIAQESQKIKAELINKLEDLKEQKLYFIPDPNLIILERYKDWFIIHAPFGSKTNDTLARIIAYIISRDYGIVVGIRTDPYRILLKAGYINLKTIKEVLENLPDEFENMLEKAIKNTDLFLWRFTHVAKRFGVIKKDADYSKSTLRRIVEELIDTPVYKETINEIFIEKMDIPNAKKVIRRIKEGKIKVKIINKERPSPLAILGLEQVVSDVMLSDKWREILRLVKERLENTELYLVCMNCKSIYKIKVKEWNENFRCNKCGGVYFGVSKGSKFDDQTLGVTADLLKYFGRKFLLTYAGKGVSYISAIRILKREYKNEEELLRYIIEEEKRFFKIRKYI